MDHSAFNYAVGRIRALETRLLSPGDVERMLAARDPQDAFRVLSDFDFSQSLGEAKSVTEFQKVLNAELYDTKKLLTSIVHSDLAWITEILWIRYDFHNLKVSLKAKLLNWNETKAQSMLLDLGSVPAKDILAFGLHGITDHIRPRFVRAAQDALQAYENSGPASDFRALEYSLDRDLHTLKIALAHRARNHFLQEFVKKEADIYNIITFFRQQFPDTHANFANLFVHGGTIPYEVFTLEEEKMLEALRTTVYGPLIRAYETFGETKEDFTALERAGDTVLLEHMLTTKHTPLGPEPIFSYYWAKKNNARVVRMIMVGKLAGLPQAKIRSRLRRLYSE